MADASKRKPREPTRYVRNQIFQSLIGRRWFFVPRARQLGDGVHHVVGKKYDITDAVESIIESTKAQVQAAVDKALPPRRKTKAAKRRKKSKA